MNGSDNLHMHLETRGLKFLQNFMRQNSDTENVS